MKINEIKWMQTTSKKLKCLECDNNLNNPDGCIRIKIYSTYEYTNYNRYICLNCIFKILSDCKTKEEREKKYKELFKKRVLRNLK